MRQNFMDILSALQAPPELEGGGTGMQDYKSISTGIQEALGAKDPYQGGRVDEILSGRFQPNLDDSYGSIRSAALSAIDPGAYKPAQSFADERMKGYMDQLSNISDMNMHDRQYGLDERKFDETLRSNKVTEDQAQQRIDTGLSGGFGSGTGVERMRDWYIAQGVPPLEAASLAQKSAGMGNTYIPGQGIVPIANSKSLDTLDQSIAAIDRVISSPGLGARTGYSSIFPAKTQGYQATSAQAKIDQLKGMGFLDAYNALRNAGQITDIEGEKATQARVRLEQATSQDEFIAALREWQDLQVQIRDRMRSQLQGVNPPSGSDIPASHTQGGGGNSKVVNGKTYENVDGQWYEQ